MKKTLLSLAAKINNLKKLKLEDLPKQRGSNDVTIPDYQTDFLVQTKKSLSGDVYEEEPIEGDLSEIDKGLNLVVDYREAAGWACDPPSLRFNKDQIGEHTNEKNLDIFKSLLKSLEFTNLRIVESECFFKHGGSHSLQMENGMFDHNLF